MTPKTRTAKGNPDPQPEPDADEAPEPEAPRLQGLDRQTLEDIVMRLAGLTVTGDLFHWAPEMSDDDYKQRLEILTQQIRILTGDVAMKLDQLVNGDDSGDIYLGMGWNYIPTKEWPRDQMRSHQTMRAALDQLALDPGVNGKARTLVCNTLRAVGVQPPPAAQGGQP